MIMEHADIRIQPGKQAEFDTAIKKGVETVIASEAMARLKAMGYRTLNWPYDELLLLIPNDGRIEQHKEIILREMRREVPWLPGLPLDAEISIAERYSK